MPRLFGSVTVPFVRAAGADADAGAPAQLTLVQCAVLALVLERPSYGYELAKRFDRAYGQDLPLSSSSFLYRTLTRLMEQGLVAELPGSRGRQPKVRYQATSAGLRVWTEALIAEGPEERRRARVLARQLAALRNRPELALQVIAGIRSTCMAELSEVPVGAPRGGELDRPSALARRLELEDARRCLEARLSWCNVAEVEFRALCGTSVSS